MAPRKQIPIAPAVFIPGYELTRVIGRGAVGTVYEALDLSMRRQVALKVLDESALTADSDLKRFEREAWIAGRLNHSNIVHVYGHGTSGSLHYIAMELLAGPSLHEEIVQTRARLSAGARAPVNWWRERIRRLVALFVGASDALQYVHTHGILHRDIKPLNMLLDGEGARLVLTDFGIAQDPSQTRVTARGDFLGTIPYMSPELLLAQRARVDARSDLWSLGMSLYEAVTLSLPYDADSGEAFVAAITLLDPLPVRRRNPAVSQDLEAVIMRCVERDPDHRYPTASALGADLRRILEDRPVLAHRLGPTRSLARWVRKHRGAIAAVAILLIAGLLSIRPMRQWSQERESERQLLSALDHWHRADFRWQLSEADQAALAPAYSTEARLDRSERLQNMALLASRRTRAAVQPFGLLSDPPHISLVCRMDFDLGFPSLCVAHFEGSWDQGPWLPVASCIQSSITRPCFKSCELGDWLPPDSLTIGPHRLDLRVRIASIRTSLQEQETTPSTTILPAEHPEALWPKVEARMKDRWETRFLGRYSVDLFSSYPAGFPPNAKSPGVGDWLRIQRVRILRASLQSGHGPLCEIPPLTIISGGKAFAVFSAGEKPPIRVPGTGPEDGLVLAIDLSANEFAVGKPMTPLAGTATIWIADRHEPLLRAFPVVVSDNSYYSLNANVYGTYMDRPMRMDTAVRTQWDADESPRQHIPMSISDRKISGRLRLEPSRSIALLHRITGFLDETIDVPVDVELRTIEVSDEAP